MKKYLFLTLILFSSCQDEISLDLPQSEKKIVVQASIEQGYPPYVILSKNEGYFDPIDRSTLTNLFITDVESIKIWYTDENGIIEESRDLELIPFLDTISIFSVNDYDFLNLNENQQPYSFSQEGRKYYLEIKRNNEIITAETTIPISTPLDCLWVEQSETSNKNYKCDIRAIYSDPIDQQNNILIKSKRIQHYERDDKDSCLVKNNIDFPFKLIDAGSDILVNGQSFETYFPRPSDNGGFPTGQYNTEHSKICNGDSIKFKNDIVLLKFCQIDEVSLRFWRGLIRQSGTNGNPFAEPANLSSNINGGLGVFTGYGTVYYRIPIIKDTVINIRNKPSVIDIF